MASRARNPRTASSTCRVPMPRDSARSDAFWMTGPSAIGSENGTPSSITSAPPAASASMMSTVASANGSPQAT